jgi:hypothetical protein
MVRPMELNEAFDVLMAELGSKAETAKEEKLATAIGTIAKALTNSLTRIAVALEKANG